VPSYTEHTPFTVTGTGFTTSVTGTARAIQIGNVVTLAIPDLAGTSNATTFTVTGVPAPLLDVPRALRMPVSVLSGTYHLGIMVLSGAGITVYADESFGAWAATGAKELLAADVTYLLS